VHVQLLSIGQKMPSWTDTACEDFIRRMPPELKPELKLLPLVKRGKNADISRIVRDEGRQLLNAVPDQSLLVALDVKGRRLDTDALAKLLDGWMQGGRDVAIVIGGPDGLSREVLERADMRLSLSDLTFPHALVRVIMLEQLYRAWSILANHPYHRA
jgi:23S rRNA (pseudouridine1915-N3)-methyltransferase